VQRIRLRTRRRADARQGSSVSRTAAELDRAWGGDSTVVTVARNVSTRYLVIGVDAILGLLVLPLNVGYFGQTEWGLWMLTASVTTYFSVLDLGYGSSLTRFVAHYRAKRDAQSLNEVLSTTALLFAGIGLIACSIFAIVAFNFGSLFNVTPEQTQTGKALLIITGLYVAVGFPFSVFGGVMNGFQRYDLNSLVGVATSVLVAVVNVAMVLSGRSLVELVAATTSIRTIAYLFYRRNAYRVFPALSLRPALVRKSRLREVTGFSLYIAMIDWSNKLSFGLDAMIIGAFLSPAAVALWMVAKRLTEFLQRVTNPFGAVLFPMVVDSEASRNPQRLRAVFLEGTRWSLVTAVPLVVAMLLLTKPLIRSWVGEGFEASVPIAQILALVVGTRVAMSTAMTVLKGAGQHRLLAWSSLVAALTNLTLSLLWIRRFALVGQAMGTLIPLLAVSAIVFWPSACRRVGIGVASAFRQAIWPTLWPVFVMAPVVIGVRDVLPSNLLSVAIAGVLGGLAYAATFLLFAVTREQRRDYLERFNQLARRRTRVPAAA
jgi:O-antigen/teichoic acid export membrane protein